MKLKFVSSNVGKSNVSKVQGFKNIKRQLFGRLQHRSCFILCNFINKDISRAPGTDYNTGFIIIFYIIFD